jgi:deazaflavin-dependent oxidoreductase (nitroreductase family)
MIRCPRCGSYDVRGRWPVRLHDRLAALCGWRPFVCWHCMRRFRRFVPPFSRAEEAHQLRLDAARTAHDDSCLGQRLTMLEGLTGRLMWWLVSVGLTPSRWPGSACGTVILEVRGRRSGRLRSLLVTWVEHEGARYLVTMPGEEPQWVKNMRAGGGHVALRHGNHRDEVLLQEVASGERAPVLQAWYRLTSVSANPRRHFRLDRSATIEEFERIAAHHPVFRVLRTPLSEMTREKDALPEPPDQQRPEVIRRPDGSTPTTANGAGHGQA